MRQGQHNKRARNRGRRQPNPVNRVYESNGPDVRVRGTAAHVAEKYMSLGRDAQISGDIVRAENFYQHAEHYLRILTAAQAYVQQQSGGQPKANANGDSVHEEDGGVEDMVATSADERPDDDRNRDDGDSGEQGESEPADEHVATGDEVLRESRPPQRRRRQKSTVTNGDGRAAKSNGRGTRRQSASANEDAGADNVLADASGDDASGKPHDGSRDDVDLKASTG